MDNDSKRPAVLFLHGGFAFGAPDDWNIVNQLIAREMPHVFA
jgi:hypothetical protein